MKGLMIKIHFEQICLAICLFLLAHNICDAAWLGPLSNSVRLGAAKITLFLDRTRQTRLKVAVPLALGGWAYGLYASIEQGVVREKSLDKNNEEIIRKKHTLGGSAIVTAYALMFPVAATTAVLGYKGISTVSQYLNKLSKPKIVTEVIMKTKLTPKRTIEEQVLQGWE
jgi:hypothetical protein